MSNEIHYTDLILLLWTGGFCIIWAIGLSSGGVRRADFGGIALVAISGIRLLWECYFLSGFAFQFPLWYGLALPAMYLIGPILFLYYERLADRKTDRFVSLHLIPFFASLVLAGLWLNTSTLIQIEFLRTLHDSSTSVPQATFFELWVIGPKISIFAYSIWIPLRKDNEGVRAVMGLPAPVRTFASILLIYVWIMIIADILGYVFDNDMLFRYSTYSHGGVAIIVYLYSRINPQAILEFERAVRVSRYARSKLRAIDVKETLDRMDALMQAQSYYADEDLKLSRLAEACSLTPHQLSELLNARMGISFNRFVNRYRVKAACTMLIEESDRNILSIAMAVGFNSKSAFHRAFREETGTTPLEYRKSHSII